MNRRALLGGVPAIVLAGCATRLGLADRVEIVQKYVRVHPRNADEPIDVAVRRYDPNEGPSYHDEIREPLAGEIDDDAPLEIADSIAERLEAEFEVVEYRIRGCDVDGGDCRHTTLVREDFNELEAGDIADIVYRSSGAGLISVHKSYESRR